MIIVYGTRKKIKIDRDLGRMTCTNCGYDVNASLAHESCYAHFCYIPVFPYTGIRMRFCPNCGIMETLTKEEFKEIKNQPS